MFGVGSGVDWAIVASVSVETVDARCHYYNNTVELNLVRLLAYHERCPGEHQEFISFQRHKTNL